jgi:uncharacterized protein YndB with AHSA1/START domain
MTGVLLVLLYFGLALLAAVILLQPDRFTVARSRVLPAAPKDVFRRIDDFHQWQSWSPWEKLDPNAQRTYEGPAAGVGAISTWSGNDKVGAGEMRILESKPNELVHIELSMLKPAKATNDVFFELAPEGSGTKLVWTMTGRRGFVAKALNLVLGIDKQIGQRFEEGLANLDAALAKG